MPRHATDMRSTVRCRTLARLDLNSVTSFISRDRSVVRLDTSLELLLESGWKNRVPGALATVVATAGSTYRKPGARMLIYADGSYLGLLSGGCLEADLQLHAQEVIEHARTRAVEYDMRGPDDILFGIGAGCEGAMRVLIEPARTGGVAAEALEAAGRILSTGEPTCLVAIHDATDLPLGTFSLSVLPPLLQDAAREALAERASRELDLGHGSARVRAFVQFLNKDTSQPNISGSTLSRSIRGECSMNSHLSAFRGIPGAAHGDAYPGEISPALAKLVSSPGAGCRSSTVTSCPAFAK